MTRRDVGFFACIAFLAVGAGPLAAQSGTVRGTVADGGGTPLPNATIVVEGTEARTVSGGRGTYELRGVPAGRYTMRVRLIGFQAATASVTVAGGDEVRQDFTLARSTVQLAPIDVVVGSRARHTAAEELAVPVDIFPAEQLAQQGSTETSVILQAVSPSINFPATERDRRRRHRPALHAARPEPRPHPGAGQRLATAPDGAGEQFHLRHGRRLERRGPQRHPVERARPHRGPARRRRRPVRLRRHCRRGEPGAQGRRVHALPQRRRGPLHHRQLPGRWHDGERERRLGHSRSAAARSAFSASSATASPPIAPGPIRSRSPGPASPTRSTTSGR